jgi:LysM repeat protein
MIINFPTGFYVNVIPASLSDVGNVTFTISDSNPPRSELLFPQIPTGLYYRKRSKNNSDRYLSDPIFYNSSANSQVLNNNTQQFEIGQLIDPKPPADIFLTNVDVYGSHSSTHNLNRLDLADMGLDVKEIKAINDNSRTIYLDLVILLNSIKASVNSYDTEINKRQKLLNETNKASSAVIVMIENLSDGVVKDELTKTKESLDKTLEITQESLLNLVASREAKALEVIMVTDELNRLALVVK